MHDVAPRVWVTTFKSDYDAAIVGVYADEDAAKDAVRSDIPSHMGSRGRFGRAGVGWQLRLTGHGVYGVYPYTVRAQ